MGKAYGLFIQEPVIFSPPFHIIILPSFFSTSALQYSTIVVAIEPGQKVAIALEMRTRRKGNCDIVVGGLVSFTATQYHGEYHHRFILRLPPLALSP